MEQINQFADMYTNLWKLRDPRLDDWLFLNSLKAPFFGLAAYFAFVIYGPKWMLHRQPFNLKWFVFAYNMTVTILNLYIFLELSICTTRQGYNWWCAPVRVSTHPDEMRILFALYLYGLSKAIEFLDTVFIIVRKKNNQLTFLHVYHHSTMLFFCWVFGRWIPGGTLALAALVNSLVHVVMYGYYGLSVFGPSVAKYLWWKKYLTIIQLMQFLLGFVICLNIYVNGCDFALWLQYVFVLYVLSYIILFGRFYVFAYIHGKSKKTV